MKTLCNTVSISLILLTLSFFYTANAQDDDTSGWPVEQRCVGEPTAPPEGWTAHPAHA